MNRGSMLNHNGYESNGFHCDLFRQGSVYSNGSNHRERERMPDQFSSVELVQLFLAPTSLIRDIVAAIKGGHLERLKSAVASVRENAPRDQPRLCRDDFVDVAEPYLNEYKDIRKVEKAFREDPDRVYAFIDSLPDPDMTVVGAQLEIDDNETVCILCLTKEELARMRNHDDLVPAISRDEADDSEYICARCGKEL